MSEEEYDHSILANASDKADFIDWYGDKYAKYVETRNVNELLYKTCMEYGQIKFKFG